MSTLKDNVQDPDYAIAGTSNQQKIFEETALINKTKRINTIIEREFGQSINEKEKEILLINDRLDEAIRTLSLLRYAIISEFYNRKGCQAGTSSDSKQVRIHPAIKQIIGKTPRNLRHRGNDGLDCKVSTSNDNKPQNSQPNNFYQNFNGLNFDNKVIINNNNNNNNKCPILSHKKHQNPGFNNEKSDKIVTSKDLEWNPLKRKNYDKTYTENISKKVCLNNEPEFKRGDGFRETRVIVIGNISTPIPPIDRNDQYTHKWQVYVREKDNEKIIEYISKVVFQLHPSYKPNDIIELDRAPFNLTRRGWGNFSINITLIFKNKSNLPRAFVHNLTLDHVSETVYALKIFPTDYTPPIYELNESTSDEDDININKSDDSDINSDDNNTLVTLKRNEIMSNIYLEHRYINLHSIGEVNRTINHSGIISMKDINGINNCLKNFKSGLGDLGGLSSVKNDKIIFKIKKINHKINKNTNGDKESMLLSSNAVCQPLEIKIPDINETMATSTVKQVLVFNDKQIPLNFNKDKKKNINGNGVSILKKNINGNKNGINIRINPTKSILLNVPDSEPALKIVTGKRINPVEKRRKNINYHVRLKESLIAFKEKEDVEKIVRFLAKQLPIITPEACDSDFKRNYPYVCKTKEEFLGFNIAKQRSVEWYRAKEIRNWLKLKIREEKLWTTKEIVLWCRFQGFTIMRALSWSSAKGEIKDINTCTESRELMNWVKKMKSSGEEKEEVDIIDIESDDFYSGEEIREEKKGEFLRLEITEEEIKMNLFVTETARQVGVTFADEEIEEGIRDAAACRVVVKAVECLLEDLLRSSLSKAWERNSYKCQDVITVNDVCRAIDDREEFDIFTNSGLGTTHQ